MRGALVVVGLCAASGPARAEVDVWKQDDSYVGFQMLIQVQGRVTSGLEVVPDDKLEVFFRRLRPAIVGAFDRNWHAMIEIDFGLGFEGEDPKTSIESTYLEYLGFEDDQQTSLKIGSMKTVFGYEWLTHGSRLLTVEPTFNGIQWYGTPDNTSGVSLNHITHDRKLSIAIAGGVESIKQEPDRIWFQSTQNQTDSSDNTGYLVSGRVDVWPIGEAPVDRKHPAAVAIDPSDLHDTQSWRLRLGAAGYGWWNNNSENPMEVACPTTTSTLCPNGLANVKRVYGGEVSGSFTGYGFGAEVEYQRLRSVLEDDTFSGGLYQDGATSMNKLTGGAGYMVYADKVQLAVTSSLMTAANFVDPWYSERLGVNWFIHEHTIELMTEGTVNVNAFGTAGARGYAGRVQAQLSW